MNSRKKEDSGFDGGDDVFLSEELCNRLTALSKNNLESLADVIERAVTVLEQKTGMLTKNQAEVLGEYCFSCGNQYSPNELRHGRCGCGNMIVSATQKQIESEFRALPDAIKSKILIQIKK